MNPKPASGPDAAPLSAAADLALRYLGDLDRRSVAVTSGVADLRAALNAPLADAGVEAEKVVRDLASAVDGGLIGSAGGRFFGWVIGGSLPAALAADWLTSAWDQNAALYACSPAAAIVEEVAGAWLKDLLGLPAAAGFGLVTGCQMAHLTCLAAARHALLARLGWDVETRGLAGSPPIRVLCGPERHGTVDRALRLLGIGSAALTPVDDLQSIDRYLSAGEPAILLLQAGDINTGAFDNFEAVIPAAHRLGAWVHVDGAFGLWAAADPRQRRLLRGGAAADSWATDGHKWLNVPYDCGYAFVADPAALHGAMAYRASYLTHSEDARDEMNSNPEWSRRARGFATYAALRQLGRRGVADLIARSCRHAQALATGIARLPGAELLAPPMLNQGLVRFLAPTSSSAERRPSSAHDRRTDTVIEIVNRGGEAFFTGTTWRGMRAMRISVCNWRTSEADIERSIAAVSAALHSL